MHIRNVLAAALAALIFSAPAKAEDMKMDGLYFKADLGMALVEDYEVSDPDFSATLELDTGFMGAIGIGKHVGDSFRVEGEVGYMKADLDKFTLSSGGAGVSVDLGGESSALSFMLAGYADLMEGPAKPYFGGGLGFAMWETKASVLGISVEDDGTDLTAFGEAGLAYQVRGNVALTGSYRYQWINGEDEDTTAHVVKAGIRYSF